MPAELATTTKSLAPAGRAGAHAALMSNPAATIATQRIEDIGSLRVVLSRVCSRYTAKCGLVPVGDAHRLQKTWNLASHGGVRHVATRVEGRLLEQVEDPAIRETDALVVRARDGDTEA